MENRPLSHRPVMPHHGTSGDPSSTLHGHGMIWVRRTEREDRNTLDFWLIAVQV